MHHPESKRLFVAAFPPRLVLDNLAMAVRSGGNCGVPWASRMDIHLTFNFLGYIKVERIAEIKLALDAVGRNRHGCTLSVDGMGCFPNIRYPKVIWAGVGGDLRGLDVIKALLDEGLNRLGCLVDQDQGFSPHLTLGRVKVIRSHEYSRLKSLVEWHERITFGPWPLDSIHLMESNLRPEGAEYGLLHTVRLHG